MLIEKELLRLLKENSRYTNEYLAKKLGVSEGTIRNRIKKLVETGKIKRFTVEVRSDASALCLIETDAKVKTSDIVYDIQKIEGIDNILEVSGDFTIALRISHESLADINDIVERIRRIDGIKNTYTHTVLNEV